MNLRSLLILPVLLAACMARAQQPPAEPALVPKSSTDSAKPPLDAAPASAPAPLTPFDSALGLYRKGELPAAASAFQAIIAQGGDDAAKSYAWLARTNLRLYKVSDAETAARKALELAPNLPTAHSALGEVYFRQGKFSDAEREFLIPLKAGIADPRSYLGVARLSWAASNYKHAKQMIDKARALDPRDRDIEDDWMYTLHRVERIKFLQARLADAGKMDAEEKKYSEAYLKKLQDRDARPAASCRLTNKLPSTEVQLVRLMLDAHKFRGFGLKVKVNGTSSNLMLDTGAGGILVNAKIAERAGLKKIADIPIRGIGDKGAANGYVAYADSIQVGGLDFQGCYISVVDSKRSLNEDGLIGADVFQDYLVEINFPDEKFRLSELPKRPDSGVESLSLSVDPDTPAELHDRYVAPEMQSYQRFYRFGHEILLPTMVNTTGNSRLFLVDTGSYSVHLSTGLARQVTKVHNDEFTILKGLSGNVKYVYRADTVKLAFSHFMLQPEDVVAFDMSDISGNTGTEVSGILGFSLLWLLDMRIDYRDGLIDFQYDPNRIR